VTPLEALQIQEKLKSKVLLERLPGAVNCLAGTDLCYSKISQSAWAGVVLFGYPGLEKLEEKWVKGTIKFPYIPGLLAFREIPMLLKALGLLEMEPDLILCDGHGIAHPKGIGLASHLGLCLSKPTIGCAKKHLVGDFSEVGPGRGEFSPLRYRGRRVGFVVRTRTGTKPVFVSPGHNTTVEESLEFILRCGGDHRIPEPLRQAHGLVTRLRRKEEAS
jgi:deoxyribonuclease V